MPILIGWITVPHFFEILLHSPKDVLWGAFLLGAVYGFGGMSFGLSIKHIGYSLTYTIAIGISAVLGTVVPLLVYGGLIEYFTAPGGMVVLFGMVMAVIGVGLSGWAGFLKEKDLLALEGKNLNFNMKIGLILVLIAGVLSAYLIFRWNMGNPFQIWLPRKAPDNLKEMPNISFQLRDVLW